MASKSFSSLAALLLVTCGWASRVQTVSSVFSEAAVPQLHTGLHNGHAGMCQVLYREQQVGLKCGQHAVNAVLGNLGMDITGQIELDAISDNVGEPAHGGDYSMATLMSLLISRDIDATTVGELHQPNKPISKLLGQVGAIGSVAGLPQAFKANLNKRKIDVRLQDLQWIICNPGGHWKTYFHVPGHGWCDLDSIGHHPQSLTTRRLGSVLCRGIIVPPPTLSNHSDLDGDLDVDQDGRGPIKKNRARQPEKGRASTQCNIWAIFSAFAATYIASSQAWR